MDKKRILGGARGKYHRVGKFWARIVKPIAKYMAFNKKINFLLEPRFSSAPFLIKYTYIRPIFPTIFQVFVFLLTYLENSAPLPPPDFS